MATLKYDFAVVGAKNVERAFSSIERRAVRHNVKMSQAMGGASSMRRGAGRSDLTAAARAGARITKQQEASRIRAERAVQREQARTARQAETQAKRLQRLRYRQAQQDLKFAKRQRIAAKKQAALVARERGRVANGIFGQAGRSAGRTLSAVGGTAATILGVGGTIAAGSAVGQQMRETAMASKLANQGKTPGLKGTLLREAQSVRGFTGEETLGALTGFVDLTGDLDTARKLMQRLGELSLATGSNFEDVASAAGNFANNLEGIKDPAKRAEAVMDAMRALAGQGQAGAIELKDLAGGGAALSAAAQQYSGNRAMNIKKAGVLAQAARSKGGAESAAEAMTALGRFTDQIASKANVLEKMGVNVGRKDAAGNITQLADPRQLIADIMDATGGDLGTISSIFGVRGKKVVQGFSESYQKGGRGGVLAQFDKLMKTEMSRGDITSFAQSRLEDPDIQFKEVMKDFNAQVGKELLPVLTRLIPEFAKLLPHVRTAAGVFGKLVERLIDSPLMSIGTLIAGKVAMDIAGARIGDVIKNGITGLISGKNSPGGDGAKGLDLSGAVFNGLSIGAAVGLSILATGVVNFEASEVQMDRAGDRLSRFRELAATGDPANLPEMQRILKEQRRETIGIQEKNDAKSSFLGDIGFNVAETLAGLLIGHQNAMDLGAGDWGRDKAIDIGETTQLINPDQQSNNEDWLREMTDSLRSFVDKQAAAADKLSKAGDKLMTAGDGGGGPSLNRPKQKTS